MAWNRQVSIGNPSGTSWSPASRCCWSMRHIKQVPGRKTDVKDSKSFFLRPRTLQYGLLRQFHSAGAQRELRGIDTAADPVNGSEGYRVEPYPEGIGGCPVSKLASVASDVLGVSGRLAAKAIIAGQDGAGARRVGQAEDAGQIPVLKVALHGRVTDHRFLLRLFLDEVTQLEVWIARVQRADCRRPAWADGASRASAGRGSRHRRALPPRNILAEIGTNMDQFPTAAHLRFVGGDVAEQQRKCG